MKLVIKISLQSAQIKKQSNIPDYYKCSLLQLSVSIFWLTYFDRFQGIPYSRLGFNEGKSTCFTFGRRSRYASHKNACWTILKPRATLHLLYIPKFRMNTKFKLLPSRLLVNISRQFESICALLYLHRQAGFRLNTFSER